MALISYSMSMVVTGGPSEAASGQVNTEAYDKIEEVIPHGSAPVEVSVQPSGEGEVAAIMIVSDNYADLSFTVDEGVTPVTLDKPLLLVGAGLIALLGATQKVFTFINAGTTLDANVTILVARNAIVDQQA